MDGTPAPRKRLSRKKIAGFIGIMVVAFYGVAEAAAWMAFRVAFEVPFSFERLQQQRDIAIPKELNSPDRPDHLTMAALHPYLGFVTDPDLANRSTPRYSEQGLLQLDATLPKREPGKVVVGIVGGSVATLFSERGIDALRRELSGKGRFSGKELVFVNLANGGHKQPQQLIALNYFLAQGAEFDVLINLDGFNEIALHPRFNAEAGVFPIYPLNWHLLTNMPDARERELIAAIAVRRQEKRTLAKQFGRSPWRYCVSANFLWKYLDRRVDKAIADCQSATLNHRKQATFQTLGPRTTPRSEEETEAELVAIWQRCSIQLDRQCRANGIAYYHFLQPNQYVPDSKTMELPEREVAFLDNHVMKTSVEKSYPHLSQAGKELARQGVRFQDLTMVFVKHPEPVYYDTCCHINKHGNEIMAGAIAQAILATPEPPYAN